MTRPFALRGSVDFDRLPRTLPTALPETSLEGRHSVACAGLEISWSPDTAHYAFVDGVVVLALGRVHGDGARSQAQRWLDRYLRDGVDAAATASGAFAVVVVDLRAPRVLLFVDAFSMEALCWRRDGSLVAFSDSASALAATTQALDPQAIYDYLYFHVIPAPGTAFAEVHRIEPSQRVIVTREDAVAQPYWTPSFTNADDHDLPARMRTFVELVTQSVAREADGATACFLSGGTDSSTIAGMLGRVREGPVHAYSIGFDAQGYDEMAYARIAARHFGLVHHEYYVTPDDLVEGIPKLAASVDQPFGNSSVVPAYYCALRAREDGFGRMLAGDGGDELFAGNSRYAMQLLLGHYERVPRALRNVIEPMANAPLFRKVPGLRQLGGYVRHARLPLPDRLESFNLLHRIDASELFEPSFVASIDTSHPLTAQRETWSAVDANTLLDRMLGYDWKYTLADNDLPKVRAATRAAGMTVGYPFLSRELAAFSLTLPARWKLRGTKLRWFFKQALRDVLPAEILRKTKHGFGLPFGPWVLRHDRLRQLAEASLAGIAERGIVKRSFARTLVGTRLAEAPGYYGELVWILMMLEQWLVARDAR